MQAEINIGLLGHVDHGKTSVTHALSGVWTDTYSEEIKRGISIRIGYADVNVYRCEACGKYSTEPMCSDCNGKAILVRKVSLLDAPGHETLMTTAISASSIIDAAILVIAADEECPQPQTKEHLMVLEAMDIDKLIVVQNKIDLVNKRDALKNYNQIKEFLEKFGYKDVPIIPMAAHFKINVDVLLYAIQKYFPTPKRDESLLFRMYIARSFDINKPSTPIDKLSGGVIGGSIIQGLLRCGDEIEIRPGIPKKESDESTIGPIITVAESLAAGKEKIDSARPGGLIGISTKLDPVWTKGDRLIGSMVGKPGTLPNTVNKLILDYKLFKRTDFSNEPFKENEPVVISIGTATTVGVIAKTSKDRLTVVLKRAVCEDKETPVAISRRIGQRWRLAGYGRIV